MISHTHTQRICQHEQWPTRCLWTRMPASQTHHYISEGRPGTIQLANKSAAENQILGSKKKISTSRRLFMFFERHGIFKRTEVTNLGPKVHTLVVNLIILHITFSRPVILFESPKQEKADKESRGRADKQQML